ncbi:MAG: OmpA family protein, partial [Rhizomicrobium sp.]
SVLPEWMGGDPAAPAQASPDLANLPDKPTAGNAATQPLADSLTADMKNSQYSADALRGGDDTAAPPPPPAPPATQTAAVVPVAAPAADAAPAPAAEPVAKDKSVFAAPVGQSAVPGALPDPTAQTSSAAPKKTTHVAALPAGAMPAQSAKPTTVAAVKPVAAKAAVKTASVEAAPVDAAPLAAVAPVKAQAAVKVAKNVTKKSVVKAAAVNPGDAALGFEPSSAPPLDPSVAEFVPAQIVRQYQTAANQPLPGSGVRSSASKRAGTKDVTYVDKPANHPVSGSNVTAVASSAAAVLYFPGDIVTVNAKAQALVHEVAAQFKAQGGQGVIRVVGHSSSRTPDMPVEKHLALVFKKSQDRANAAAQALIRAGVPADKILVEAVGDSQPVYFESMPKGEDGNRRVEIFLQS